MAATAWFSNLKRVSMIEMISGPPNTEYPYRYGCACGANWNTKKVIVLNQKGLCGPFCRTTLFEVDDVAPTDDR